MIVDPPIGKLLERVDCRYTLAVEASKRAREIIGGAKPLIETKETKPLAIAIEEISRGLVMYSRSAENDAEKLPDEHALVIDSEAAPEERPSDEDETAE